MFPVVKLGYSILLAAALVGACAAVTPTRAPAPDTLTAALAEWAPQPSGDPGQFRAATLSGPPRYAIATVRPVLGGMPLAHVDERPIAGQPWQAMWTTRPTAPYPDLPMRLIVSLTPPGTTPAITQTFLPGQAGVTQQGGRLYLDVTFPPQWIGLRLWMQAVVSDRRSLAGELATPVLEVVVGEA